MFFFHAYFIFNIRRKRRKNLIKKIFASQQIWREKMLWTSTIIGVGFVPLHHGAADAGGGMMIFPKYFGLQMSSFLARLIVHLSFVTFSLSSPKYHYYYPANKILPRIFLILCLYNFHFCAGILTYSMTSRVLAPCRVVAKNKEGDF